MMCMGTKLVVAIFFSLFRPSRGSVDEIAAIKHPLAPARSTWSLRCANACRHHKNNARFANYFLSNHFNFTVFYPHQLIGIFPESFFMNARPEAERRISTFNFPFLFLGLGRVFC